MLSYKKGQDSVDMKGIVRVLLVSLNDLNLWTL